MLSDLIDSVIDILRKGENPNLESVQHGKYFLDRLISDYRNFRQLIKNHDLPTDKREWLDSDLFPLTVEILNREKTPGDRAYVGFGRTQICVVYYGFSPELENFVAICLWPELSQSSKDTYRKIYEIVSTDRDVTQVIKFNERFGLELPNLIHPWLDRTVESRKKMSATYDWRYVPYLIDCGNTLLSHKSPINFQKAFIESKSGRVPTYINIKTSLGNVLEVRKDGARILVPALYSRDLEYRVQLTANSFQDLRTLEKPALYHLLICERAEENVVRLVQRVAPATSVEATVSMMLFAMYLMFLGSHRLRVLRKDRLNSLINLCAKSITRVQGVNLTDHSLLAEENVYRAYIEPFFRRIGQYLFYVPRFISYQPNQVLELFDSRLAEKKATVSDHKLVFSNSGQLLDRVELAKEFQLLNFLIASKRFVCWTPSHEMLYQAIRVAVGS